MDLRAQTVVFIPQNQISTLTSPEALALVTFGANGQSDLVVANGGSASLSILRSLGNGYFAPFATQTTGSNPRAIAVGDFNRDGNLDVAVANSASNNVTILLGNGNGAFRFVTNLSAKAPVALATADFNQDGKLDLAVVEAASNDVSIFLGNGAGVFFPLVHAGTGAGPIAIAAADFNGDGRMDLAVANAGSNDVSILLGNGNGTFVPARSFAAGPVPSYLALGDFNGDGQVDLAVANRTSPGSVSLLLSAGSGVFLAPRTFAVGDAPSFLVSGDFNLDGNTDLAVANSGGGNVSILLGQGSGTFVPHLDFAAGSAPDWISVADLNGDGKPDLLVANGASNNISVLINRTAAQVSPSVASVENAASLQSGQVTPGELITISGSNLGPEPAAGVQVNATGFVSTQLGQTQVLFDGIPAPLLYAGSGQLNAVVPYALAGQNTTQLVITNGSRASAPQTLGVSPGAPGVFTLDSTGQGAILNQDGSLNSVTNPAARGSIVVLYATGGGQTNPPGADGLLATSVLPSPILPVSVNIGGQPAQVLYAGAAPGLVAGVMQVNVRLPDAISSGPAAVILQVGTMPSQPGVTLNVQ